MPYPSDTGVCLIEYDLCYKSSQSQMAKLNLFSSCTPLLPVIQLLRIDYFHQMIKTVLNIEIS